MRSFSCILEVVNFLTWKTGAISNHKVVSIFAVSGSVCWKIPSDSEHVVMLAEKKDITRERKRKYTSYPPVRSTDSNSSEVARSILASS